MLKPLKLSKVLRLPKVFCTSFFRGSKKAPLARRYFRPRRFFCAFLLAFLLFAFSGCNRAEQVGLNPGDIAPPFSLPSTEGTTVSLADFQGKLVLLNFWASWCGSCLAEMSQLEELYEAFSDKGFVVLAVGSEDTLDNLKEFKQKLGLRFPVLVDEKGEIKRLYQVNSFPETFFIDKKARLLLTEDFPSGLSTLRISGPREWASNHWKSWLQKTL